MGGPARQPRYLLAVADGMAAAQPALARKQASGA